MARDKIPFATMDGTPWSGTAVDVYKSVASAVPCDSVAVAVWSIDSPSLDELLVVHNVPARTLSQWTSPDFLTLEINRSAIQRGCAIGEAGKADGFAGLGHLMVHAWPQSLKHNRWWWLIIARRDRRFTQNEEAASRLIVQRWATEFNRPSEALMGRVLLGSDNRVLCADLTTQHVLIQHPDALAELLENLQPIVQQRFPDIGSGEPRDFVANVANAPHWVVVRRSQPTSDAKAGHWYLELRPLQNDELPVIGPIEDERIARAIAFLHANYQKSPSLAQIARAVHTSPFHFHRLFTKEVGVSPKQYLQRRQLQIAKWMLRATREPIGAIAGETGFASHGHFTSTFHRVVGVSPSDYRDEFALGPSSNN